MLQDSKTQTILFRSLYFIVSFVFLYFPAVASAEYIYVPPLEKNYLDSNSVVYMNNCSNATSSAERGLRAYVFTATSTTYLSRIYLDLFNNRSVLSPFSITYKIATSSAMTPVVTDDCSYYSSSGYSGGGTFSLYPGRSTVYDNLSNYRIVEGVQYVVYYVLGLAHIQDLRQYGSYAFVDDSTSPQPDSGPLGALLYGVDSFSRPYFSYVGSSYTYPLSSDTVFASSSVHIYIPYIRSTFDRVGYYLFNHTDTSLYSPGDSLISAATGTYDFYLNLDVNERYTLTPYFRDGLKYKYGAAVSFMYATTSSTTSYVSPVNDAAVSQALFYGVTQPASSTCAISANPFEFPESVSCFLTYLFVPSQQALDQFTDIPNAFRDRAPFSYVYNFIDVIARLSDHNYNARPDLVISMDQVSDELDIELPDITLLSEAMVFDMVGENTYNSIMSFFSSLLWLTFAWAAFRRAQSAFS